MTNKKVKDAVAALGDAIGKFEELEQTDEISAIVDRLYGIHDRCSMLIETEFAESVYVEIEIYKDGQHDYKVEMEVTGTSKTCQLAFDLEIGYTSDDNDIITAITLQFTEAEYAEFIANIVAAELGA